MPEPKSRLLYVLKYLWQNTDAEHYAEEKEWRIPMDGYIYPADCFEFV